MRVALLALTASAATILAADSGTPTGPGPLDRAALEFDAGRYDSAAEILEIHLGHHPEDIDARVKLGWCRYRSGRHGEALDVFREALRLQPLSEDAGVGAGYALLQTEGPGPAAEAFRGVLSQNARNTDALRGLMLAGGRAGPDRTLLDDAVAAAARLLELDPRDRDAAGRLAALEAARGGWFERRLRGPADPTEPLRVSARAGRNYLELAGPDGRWRPFFIKGINLSTALPGKFPSQFPTDEATYRGWFDMIAGLGANSIRVYTLLPPAFYAALAAHNGTAQARRLYLIQGVWTELPPGHDFSDPTYVAEFQAEIARVIDAVHGNLLLAPRRGHASGLYDTDASGSLLAYIIGREWEPFAVKDYNALRPDETSWQGDWLRVPEGRAMEAWVARMCDFAAGYEASRYRTLHPLTFANWPTLDPLPHPTEATRAEEDVWRRHYGVETHERLKDAPWEDDAVTLDSTKILPTGAMTAGFFAAYHIYPNFPDFLNLQSSYGDTLRSRYREYLDELKAYHGDQPVVVAEFGISTSRGIAHLQPEGP
jgi:tetratricopeptide (TPR) repeat protein